MAKQKQYQEYTDAKGNLIKQWPDGRSEMYEGGCDKKEQIAEVTDEADRMANRRRFKPYIAPPIEATLQTRDDPDIEDE